MGTFDHVHPGQPISGIPAAAYNAALDAARAHQQSGTLFDRKAALQAVGPVVWVRNNTGSALARFDVTALGLPIIVPADNESEFEQQVMFEGGTPSVPADLGEWAITLEPIPAGKIGRAMVSGLCQVRLYVPEGQEEYEFADVAGGATGYLLLQREGPAQILWRESGTSTSTEDLKWAVVRLGLPARRGFWVRLTAESGDLGGDYSWIMLQDDGETPVDPEISGENTAHEVSDREGLRTDADEGEEATSGTVVWAWPAGFDDEGAPLLRFEHRPAEVSVKNTTANDLSKFDVLGVSGVEITPATSLSKFKRRVALTGTTPAVPDHRGKFVVLLDDLPAGAVGRAIASGLCHVQISVSAGEEALERADVDDGQVGHLVPRPDGSAQILWRETGTGTRWAIVRLGPDRRRGFWARLTAESSNLGDYSWIMLEDDASTEVTPNVTGSWDGTDKASEVNGREKIGTDASEASDPNAPARTVWMWPVSDGSYRFIYERADETHVYFDSTDYFDRYQFSGIRCDRDGRVLAAYGHADGWKWYDIHGNLLSNE